MKIEALNIDDENFYIEHLSDSSEDERLISDFKAFNGAKGLENYLKYQALDDEKSRNARTYLVKDKLTDELAGYFSLRSGLITIQAYRESFDTISAVELSNLAINGEYRENHKDKKASFLCVFAVVHPSSG